MIFAFFSITHTHTHTHTHKHTHTNTHTRINIKRYFLVSVDFCIVLDYRFSVFSAYQPAKKPVLSPRNARHRRTLEDKSECKSSNTLRQHKPKANVWWTPPTVQPPPPLPVSVRDEGSLYLHKEPSVPSVPPSGSCRCTEGSLWKDKTHEHSSREKTIRLQHLSRKSWYRHTGRCQGVTERSSFR